MRFYHPLDDLFQGRSHVKVLRALSAIPEGLDVSIREVARRAGVSHPTASGVLDGLRQQGVVHVRRTPSADHFRVNPQHALWSELLPVLRWERRLREEVVGFLADEIAERAPWVSGAYLFGSASRDDMESNSDVDIAVVCPADRITATEEALEALGESLADRFGNRLSVIVGSRPIDELTRSGRPGYRLWRQIAADGIPVIATAPE